MPEKILAEVMSKKMSISDYTNYTMVRKLQDHFEESLYDKADYYAIGELKTDRPKRKNRIKKIGQINSKFQFKSAGKLRL